MSKCWLHKKEKKMNEYGDVECGECAQFFGVILFIIFVVFLLSLKNF